MLTGLMLLVLAAFSAATFWVARRRVVAVTDDVVITRPGPRIVDGLEALARAIHPDAFAN